MKNVKKDNKARQNRLWQYEEMELQETAMKRKQMCDMKNCTNHAYQQLRKANKWICHDCLKTPFGIIAQEMDSPRN